MDRNPAIARALEEVILPDLPHSTVYWSEDGQSVVIVDPRPLPYIITVEPDPYTDDVRTYSTAGDGWQPGWEA